MTISKIIDGKQIASNILDNLKTQIEQCGLEPKLAIILIGDNPASLIYVNNKIKRATFVGIETELIHLSPNTTQKKLISIISQLNQDQKVSGIIMQLPLVKHINFEEVIECIDPNKDVDGFHPLNVGRLHNMSRVGASSTGVLEHFKVFVPCTALGCLTAIKSVRKDLTGQNIVVINRSSLVGKPLSALLLQHDATVTVCHSFSNNLKEITRQADIVVCAIGRAKFFDKSYFKEGAIVIDVGINREDSNGQSSICGDVNFDDLMNHASYITPVPGGIGPLTIAYLLSNTLLSTTRLKKY